MSRKTTENLISQVEAARLRGCSRQAIFDLIQRGKLKTYSAGIHRLVDRTEVMNLELDPRGRPRGKKKSNRR